VPIKRREMSLAIEHPRNAAAAVTDRRLTCVVSAAIQLVSDLTRS
jgi:hypothetical protein